MLNRSYGVVDGKMEVPAPLVRKWNRSILTCLVVETLQSTCFLRVSGNFNQWCSVSKSLIVNLCISFVKKIIFLLEIDSFFCYSQTHVYLAICYWIWDVSQLTRCFMLCCRVAHNCHSKTKKTSWSAVVICIWNSTSCNSNSNRNTLLARKIALFRADDVLHRVWFGSRWRCKYL